MATSMWRAIAAPRRTVAGEAIHAAVGKTPASSIEFPTRSAESRCLFAGFMKTVQTGCECGTEFPRLHESGKFQGNDLPTTHDGLVLVLGEISAGDGKGFSRELVGQPA